MDLRAMEETSRAGAAEDEAGGGREEEGSGLADALGALGRARALHSIQSLAQSRGVVVQEAGL